MKKRTHVLSGLLLGVVLGTYLEWESGQWTILARIVELSVPITLGVLFPDIDTEFGTHRKTLHNLPVLIGIFAFPLVFGNLEYVWIGVLLHYLEDMYCRTRGVAWLYPLTAREFRYPSVVLCGA